jgi:hypothetical protein
MSIKIIENEFVTNQVDFLLHGRVVGFVWEYEGQWLCRMGYGDEDEVTYWPTYEDAEAYAILMMPDDLPTLH